MLSKRGQAYNVFLQQKSPSENIYAAKNMLSDRVNLSGLLCYDAVLSLEESLNY